MGHGNEAQQWAVYEVMTAASREYDLTFKQELYIGMKSVEQNICMDCTSMKVYCWTKKKGWQWQRDEFADMADEIVIEVFGAKVAIAQI